MVLSTSEFWATFLVAIGLYFPKQLDQNLRVRSTPQEQLASYYDFIIVGAGSAGCVLANRLTESPEFRVLLIEAGSNEDFKSDTPFLAEFLSGTDKDWNYTTVRQKRACLSDNGVCQTPKGKVVGGSSTINGMMYIRGNRAAYDDWERLGNRGWAYKDILPYFIKAENMTEPVPVDGRNYGNKGPLNVQYSRYTTPMWEEYIKAGQELGWNFTDYNGEDNANVIDYLKYTLRNHLRESAARAYLYPIKTRENLDIILSSVVSKVVIENRSAKGVVYHREGEFHTVFAKKDVILSAGAIETPKLLMLSGIGPSGHLYKHNIDVVMDLPVGQRYQAHVEVGIHFELNENAVTVTEDTWKTKESIIAYAKGKEGPLTMPARGTEAVSFFNPLRKNEPPSIQTIYSSAAPTNDFGNKHIIRAFVVNIHPHSEGSIKLKSQDFKDTPLLDPNIFFEEIDKKTLTKGVEKVFEFMESKKMSKYSPKLYTGGVQRKCHGKTRKEYIGCVVPQYSQPKGHSFGTARMGSRDDNDTVVTSEDLRVKGISGLRVVDASVIPRSTGVNSNAPVIIIAEKAADIIKNYHQNEVMCHHHHNDHHDTTTSDTGTTEATHNHEPEKGEEQQSSSQYSNNKPNIVNYVKEKLQNLIKPK